MAHGVEPILSFDIMLATFLVPDIPPKLDTAGLLAIRTCQLQKRKDDLAAVHTNVLRNRFKSVQQFERTFEKTIKDFNFQPHLYWCATLVLKLTEHASPSPAMLDQWSSFAAPLTVCTDLLN